MTGPGDMDNDEGLIMQVGGGLGRRGRRGEKWDNCNSINNKIFFKEKRKITPDFRN